jgi:hypothetical protein
MWFKVKECEGQTIHTAPKMLTTRANYYLHSSPIEISCMNTVQFGIDMHGGFYLRRGNANIRPLCHHVSP